MATTEKRTELRQERIPAISLWDSVSASMSDHYLTLSRLYRQGEKEEFDFLLLNKEEAKRLFNFLKEVV